MYIYMDKAVFTSKQNVTHLQHTSPVLALEDLAELGDSNWLNKRYNVSFILLN